MDNPVVNLEGLSRPLTKLVEVVSAGIGTLYAPFGTVRQAKADAKALIIRATAEQDVATINQRVAARLEHREAIRQENLERVTSVAAQELPSEVSDKRVDTDWTLQYLDHAQDVCDEQLQVIWGRILAGEVASPGSYSKRTLAFLSTLDKWEAMAFTDFCSFALEDEDGWRFVFHDKAYFEMMREKFDNRGIEEHFASVGLLQPSTGMPAPSDLNGRHIAYFGQKYQLAGPPKAHPPSIASLESPIPIRDFTSIGQQLARISGASPIDEFIPRLSASMMDDGVRFEAITS
jgi:Protein of unknown function (DUF2806)